jgi:hypothetical protein
MYFRKSNAAENIKTSPSVITPVTGKSRIPQENQNQSENGGDYIEEFGSF